jgi:hypothetical protein
MISPATIAAGASIVGTISSIWGGNKAAKAQKEAAKAQSMFTYETRQEEIRRAKLEQNQVLGYNKAAIGASNILFDGSAMKHLNAMRSEFAKDIAWRERAALLEQTAIRKGGQGAGIGPMLVKGAAEIAETVANYNR